MDEIPGGMKPGETVTSAVEPAAAQPHPTPPRTEPSGEEAVLPGDVPQNRLEPEEEGAHRPFPDCCAVKLWELRWTRRARWHTTAPGRGDANANLPAP